MTHKRLSKRARNKSSPNSLQKPSKKASLNTSLIQTGENMSESESACALNELPSNNSTIETSSTVHDIHTAESPSLMNMDTNNDIHATDTHTKPALKLTPGVISHTPAVPEYIMSEEQKSVLTSQLEQMLDDDRDKRLCSALMVLFSSMTESLVNNITKSLRKENQDLNDEKQDLKRKVAILEDKVVFLENQCAEGDMYSKRHNLLFSGLPEKSGPSKETNEMLSDWFTTLCNNWEASSETSPWPECEQDTGPIIRSIHRTGRATRGKPRDVIVQFENLDTKKLFYKSRFEIQKLKDTSLSSVHQGRSDTPYSKIFIRCHYPWAIQEQRKVLQAVAAEAKIQFPTLAKDRSISVYDNVLYIGRQRYKTTNLHELPACLKPVVDGYRESDTSHIFFTKRSKLSNHYASPFKHKSLDGTLKDYKCGEQYFMETKALYFDDTKTAEAIMNTDNPSAQKGLGRNITGYEHDKWIAACPSLLLPGLKARFEQNPECLKALLKTGSRNIGEATTETPWGIGFRLSDPEALDTTKWHDKNLMGLILQEIRKRLTPK